MKVIEVIPNPYIALDKDGVPQGVVGAGMPGVFIGAQLDLNGSRKTGKNRYFFPRPMTTHRDPKRVEKDVAGHRVVKVKLTGDILTAVQAGELIACTKEDALLCGLTDKEYLEPAKAMEAEKAKALAYWQSVRGKDAKVGEIPREETKLQEGETLPVETATKELSPNLKMTKEG